jgi:hypothetical protein
MRQGKGEVWTIHLSDRCVPAREVHVDVPLKTVFRPEGRQPRAWFEGSGVVVPVGHGVYQIVDLPLAAAVARAEIEAGRIMTVV